MKVLIIAFAFLFSSLLGSVGPSPSTIVLAQYKIDASKSEFIVHAKRGGVAWFKGHDHRIAVRDFSGEASLTPDVVNPASLQMSVQAASLEETDAYFSQPQKDIINKELDELVLETAKYPEITFRSKQVKGGLKNGKIEVVIVGDLSLHGVTKSIEIPATVTLDGNSLRAKGEFEIDRSDFNVEATSAFHGFVRVKKTLKFTFDIIAERI